ncbi:hypothetical protein [Actinacidiphila acididurans]|nr:hypothetical protein [Actinacidiphila acididurans]
MTPYRTCWDVGPLKTEPGKRYLIEVWNDQRRTAPYSFHLVPR